MHLKTILEISAAVVVLVVVITLLPDFLRYMKIRSM